MNIIFSAPPDVIDPDADSLVIYHNPLGAATFDPTITTSISTSITWQNELGRTITTGTTHNFSYTPTAGPKICKIKVTGGLGLILTFICSVDAVTFINNVGKFSSSFNDFENHTNTGLATDLSKLYKYPLLYLWTYATACYGDISKFPSTLRDCRVYSSTGIVVAGSIAHMTASRDLRFASNGWSAANVDTVLLSVSDAIHANVNTFTYATPVINVGGTNGAPTGDYVDPLVTPGSGNTDANWLWDAAAGKHKALKGMPAIWVMVHNTGHTWTVTYNGGVKP